MFLLGFRMISKKFRTISFFSDEVDFHFWTFFRRVFAFLEKVLFISDAVVTFFFFFTSNLILQWTSFITNPLSIIICLMRAMKIDEAVDVLAEEMELVSISLSKKKIQEIWTGPD